MPDLNLQHNTSGQHRHWLVRLVGSIFPAMLMAGGVVQIVLPFVLNFPYFSIIIGILVGTACFLVSALLQSNK